jgi:uncharacterized protein YecT (DUF1311 family)
MQMKRLILSAFLVPLALPVIASQSVPTKRDLYEMCGDYSQAEMRDCLAKQMRSSEIKLKRAEQTVTAALSKWDEDPPYIQAAQTALSNSKRAFAAYRRAQCEFSMSLSGGGAGNAREMGRLTCIAELNNRRAQQLQDSVLRLPVK